MKPRVILSTVLLCTLTACAFFEVPLDDPGATAAPVTAEPATAAPVTAEPANNELASPTPQLPSTSQTTQALTQASSVGTYLIVSTIFDVPETSTNLSFVHFTDRSGRRENTICEALLDMHQVTKPADVPANARNLIVWPIVEGETANNCRSMVRAHEPLDISSETAAIVNSDGPYLLTRNTSQQKQLIYDLSSVSTRDLENSLTEWQQTLATDVQSWPPVVKAK